MNLVVIPNNLNNIREYVKIGAKAFIFGLKGFSVNCEVSLTLDEIDKVIIEYPEVEFFISINKNLFNDELEFIEKALIRLSKMRVAGVLFYDLAILNIKIKHNLDLDLVWNQTHMVTNYNTCNYYYEKGVKYGVLASEITKEEIIDIANKTKMRLMVNIFGHQVMSLSKRKLLTNYYKASGIETTEKKMSLYHREEVLDLLEEDAGTSIIYGKVLNGIDALEDIDVSYVILNEYDISEDLFKKVLSLYREYIDTKDKGIIDKVDALVGDYRGFLYNKTIYKVKKND